MKIEFNANIDKNNNGIDELLKNLSKKGTVSFDFKKGTVIIEDFPNEKLEIILSIIRSNFEITSLNFNKGSNFKLRNQEKELQIKKKQMRDDISKNPKSIVSKVREYILNEEVFTLTQLRETFPKTNFGTLRSYVNDMKNDNILIELERGKYAVR